MQPGAANIRGNAAPFFYLNPYFYPAFTDGANGPANAGFPFMPFPFPLGQFGMDKVEERDDPERAKRLVDGLEEVPVDMVKRIERAGGPGTTQGETPTWRLLSRNSSLLWKSMVLSLLLRARRRHRLVLPRLRPHLTPPERAQIRNLWFFHARMCSMRRAFSLGSPSRGARRACRAGSTLTQIPSPTDLGQFAPVVLNHNQRLSAAPQPQQPSVYGPPPPPLSVPHPPQPSAAPAAFAQAAPQPPNAAAAAASPLRAATPKGNSCPRFRPSLPSISA
ncbi:hypothetical protein ONZ51_g11520 [Trametes cubensis]|uniref:Uncharacterized protein n=1 Tax=Trametes cubensis TaxID=1111947 RepID=A0AAD7TIJ9_9APHY|nr:hypothetical protein ONZ51_g11520 [Trametes cubensis]